MRCQYLVYHEDGSFEGHKAQCLLPASVVAWTVPEHIKVYVCRIHERVITRRSLRELDTPKSFFVMRGE